MKTAAARTRTAGTTSANRHRPTNAGRRAEAAAARWLRRHRVRILRRNYHCRQGEIDIVGLQGDTLLFIEVRLRNSNAWGGAAASVHREKQRRIVHTARHFLQSEPGHGDRPCRFDVLCAVYDARGAVHISDWIQDAFAA